MPRREELLELLEDDLLGEEDDRDGEEDERDGADDDRGATLGREAGAADGAERVDGACETDGLCRCTGAEGVARLGVEWLGTARLGAEWLGAEGEMREARDRRTGAGLEGALS